MLTQNEQLIRKENNWLFQHGSCNLVAEIVQQELNLTCYMVFHRYLDYDETGERYTDGTYSISPNQLRKFNTNFNINVNTTVCHLTLNQSIQCTKIILLTLISN